MLPNGQGTLLDEVSGVKKKEAPLVMVTKTPKQAPACGGWNKKVIVFAHESYLYECLPFMGFFNYYAVITGLKFHQVGNTLDHGKKLFVFQYSFS